VPHEPVACAGAHGTPHWPQLLLVLSWVSQPSFALPSFALQSSQPALQATISHVPDEHKAVPWALVQAVPQAPQLVSEFKGVSQPLFLLPSQSPQPEAQLGAQPFVVHSFSP
jgi:hypothetical protein